MAPLSSFRPQQFLFTPETLSQRLVQESDFSLVGYWHHKFQGPTQSSATEDWYLGLLEGRAIFSDSRPMSVGRLFAIIERYVPRLRSTEAKQIAESLQQKFIPKDYEHQLEVLPILLGSCYDSNLIRPEEVKQALRFKLLNDLDQFLFDYGGQAEFLSESDFRHQVPIVGFDLNELIAEAHRRRLIWDKVTTLIPSADSILVINEVSIQKANLPAQHEQHLRALVGRGKSLNDMAINLAQDTLNIAKSMAQLVDKGAIMVDKGVLTIQTTAKPCEKEILIIDDSLLMLQQFKMLVSSWGYKVRSHSEPTSALGVMAQSNPIAIFLDINMPDLSGFDLIKQIRRQPKLANVPLIMLTAERTLSNNWRAQWSGCQFLSKPLAPEEIPKFKQELRLLLDGLAA